MQTRSKRILWAAVLGVMSLIAALAPWLLSDDRRQPPPLVEPGRDELGQIVANHDGSAEGSAHDGSAELAADRIRGRVVRPSGEPAAGATITIQGPALEVPIVELADTGGLFDAGSLPRGFYVVEASLEGFGPAAVVGIAPGRAPVQLRLESGREIAGVVLRDDAPVAGAIVHIGSAGTFPQRTVTADAQGRFRVSGVRPGVHELVAVTPGAGSGFGARVTFDDTAGDAIHIEVPVYTAPRVTFRLVDRATREPVDFAVVTVAEQPLHVVALNARVEGGLGAFTWLPRGAYHLSVRAPGYLPYSQVLEIGDADGEIEIELSRGSIIRGSVRDPAGNPLPDVELSLYVETPGGARWQIQRSVFDEFHRLVRPDGTTFWTPAVGYSTRHDGTFELQGIPAGTAWLVARAPGYAPAVSAQLTLQTDEVFEPVDLRFVPSRALRGRVENAAAGAVSGAFVIARDPRTPAWVATEERRTDTNGIFRFDELPSQVVLMVRHPSYSPAEVQLELPPEGLDDVVIRLGEESLPGYSGRVFAADGSAAVGAVVWLLQGANPIPVCRATVSDDAWFRASPCTASPDRILVSYPWHAVLSAEVGTDDEPRDWHLPRGGEIDVVSQRLPVTVTVEHVPPFPVGIAAPAQFSLDRWERRIVDHLAVGQWRVICASPGYDDRVLDVTVEEGRRVTAECPWMEPMTSFELYVIDSLGAPVANALVFVDGMEPPLRGVTDARGAIRFEAAPNQRLAAEAFHESWGHGELEIRVPAEQSEPFRLTLDTGIAGDNPDAFFDELESWGVMAVRDGRSVIVDGLVPDSAAGGVGLQRHDRLLWAREIGSNRYSIGVRRDGRLMTFDLFGEATP